MIRSSATGGILTLATIRLTLQCAHSLFLYRALIRKEQMWQVRWLQGATDWWMTGLAQIKQTSSSSSSSSPSVLGFAFSAVGPAAEGAVGASPGLGAFLVEFCWLLRFWPPPPPAPPLEGPAPPRPRPLAFPFPLWPPRGPSLDASADAEAIGGRFLRGSGCAVKRADVYGLGVGDELFGGINGRRQVLQIGSGSVTLVDEGSKSSRRAGSTVLR